MSKFLSLSGAAFLLWAPVAQARYLGPLMLRTVQTGKTAPEFKRETRCTIYADHVVIEDQLGYGSELSRRLTRQIEVGFAMQPLVDAVRKQIAVYSKQNKKLPTLQGPTDQGGIAYIAYALNSDDTVEAVKVLSKAVSSAETESVFTEESRRLQNYIDSICH